MNLDELPALIITGVVYAVAVLAFVDVAFRRWFGDPNDDTYQDKERTP